MTTLPTFGQASLRGLARLREARRRRLSSWDRTGGNRDFISIARGATVPIADIQGAGAITHLWMTINCADPLHLRKLVLRMYWDGEAAPSVETPLGDFFGLGHALYKNFATPVLAMSPQDGRGLNCFFPMPFADGARITVENQCATDVAAFYFYVDYEEYDALPDGALRFHAQWRRENPTRGIKGDLTAQGINYWSLMGEPNVDGRENYVILEAEGAGHYVGCSLSVDNIDPTPDGLTWWGEGDDMIYIDGESTPSMVGTGSEDYFCHAWGMHPQGYPYAGTSVHEHDPDHPGRRKATAYRFHIEDPLIFTKSLKVTIEHGHANLQSNDYSSVAYWYQTEPHKPFPPLPDAVARRPRPDLR